MTDTAASRVPRRRARSALVVGGGVAGLTAARAAGCGGLVAVTSTTPAEELEPVADLVVRDVAALGIDASGGLARVVSWA